MSDKFMVFDVESIGLHGEGFAVGWVIVDRQGNRLAEAVYACDPGCCLGAQEDREWVRANVPALPITHQFPGDVRKAFWQDWRQWAEQDAVLVSDCGWPVEANFLSACIKDDAEARTWKGPYPLHDLASVLLALGGNGVENTRRLPDEMPLHHPLMDARQSARQLVECLRRGLPSPPEQVQRRTTEQWIEAFEPKPGAPPPKAQEKPPLDPAVIPNYMGINLCSVEGIEWLKRPDGQLVWMTVRFIPASFRPAFARKIRRRKA